MLIKHWSIILYDLHNQPILDISDFVAISLELNLNDVDTFSCSMDLYILQGLVRQVGATMKAILYPQRTEIRVAKDGVLLFGGIVSGVTTSYGENGATIDIKADSYLQYFATRFLNKNYTNTDRSAIAWDAIDTVQSEANGSLGITQGTLATIFNSDLTNDYQDVKTIIQRFTYAKPTTYDFEITPDKVFNTYTRLGSDKPGIVLSYPHNIISMTVPRNADGMANRIIGMGSGQGEERLQTVQDNLTSQINNRIVEKKMSYNSVLNQTTLDQNVQGMLGQIYESLVIPELSIDETTFDVTSTKIGDAVTVKVDDSDYDDDLNGLFRIAKQTIGVDENEHEDIKLTFYNPNSGGALSEDM